MKSKKIMTSSENFLRYLIFPLQWTYQNLLEKMKNSRVLIQPSLLFPDLIEYRQKFNIKTITCNQILMFVLC